MKTKANIYLHISCLIFGLFTPGFCLSGTKPFPELGSKSYRMTHDFGPIPFGEFSEGLVASRNSESGLWGFRDRDGEWVIKPRYAYAGNFSESRALVKLNGDWTYIDKDGRRIIQKHLLWSFDAGQFSEGRAAVRTESGWGYIDKTGNMIIQPRFQWASKFRNGLAWVRVNDRKGFIDSNGDWIIKPRYDDAGHFSGELAPVKSNGEWGYINKTGDWVIDPQYEWASSFNGETASVKKSGKVFPINRNGKRISETYGSKNASIEQVNEADVSSDDAPGTVIVPPTQNPGVIWSSTGWNHLTANGELLFDRPRPWVSEFTNGLAVVDTPDAWAWVDTGGDVVFRQKKSDQENLKTRNRKKLVEYAGPGEDPSTVASTIFRETGGERYLSERERCGVDRCWELANYGGTRPLHTVEVSRYPNQRPSPGHIRSALDLLTESFRSARKHGWFDYEKARADGFRPVKRLDPIKAHHVNDTFMADGNILDPDRPENLMFYQTGDGKKLVGMMYVMNSNYAEGPQVGGPLTIWHYHNLETTYCRKYGQLPVGPAIEGNCRVGKPSKRSPEMIHVWFVDHPQGPFATPMMLLYDFINEISDKDIGRQPMEALKTNLRNYLRETY
ncbi:MAG: WG repeat-containing protein [bacterium]